MDGEALLVAAAGTVGLALLDAANDAQLARGERVSWGNRHPFLATLLTLAMLAAALAGYVAYVLAGLWLSDHGMRFDGWFVTGWVLGPWAALAVRRYQVREQRWNLDRWLPRSREQRARTAGVWLVALATAGLVGFFMLY